MPGISLKARLQSICHPRSILLVTDAQVARTGRAANHQNAHCQAARENFANHIDDGTNLTRHAFDKILPDQKYRLDCPNCASLIPEQQIMMFEIAFQRFFDDLVVTMIFALVLKRPFPCGATLQLSARNNFHRALWERDSVAMRHRKRGKGWPIKPA